MLTLRFLRFLGFRQTSSFGIGPAQQGIPGITDMVSVRGMWWDMVVDGWDMVVDAHHDAPHSCHALSRWVRAGEGPVKGLWAARAIADVHQQ